MTTVEVRQLIARTRTRGRALAAQAQSLVDLSSRASIDLSTPLGAVLLLGQGYAKAVEAGLSTIMVDAGFLALPLDLQGDVARQATLWAELRAGLGSFAFRARWPLLNEVMSATPGARWYGSNARGVELASQLEALMNAPALAGISVDTFWAITASARTSLGRLASVDLVLTRTYDFSVLSELGVLLEEGAPLQPDVAELLVKVDAVKAQAYREQPIDSVRAITVTEGLTLSAIAERLLGVADAWPMLAQLNSLRFPYISDDLADQLGDVQGQLVLMVQALTGAQSLTLTDVSNLYVDQRVRLDNGFVSEVVRITSIDAAVSRIGVSPPLANTYSVTSVLTVYAPSYDVTGRVLRTGDVVLIPISSNRQAHALDRNTLALTSSASRLYGDDVQLSTQGLFIVQEGDLQRVSGTANLTQALRHRYATPRGSLPHRPGYGCGLEGFLGLSSQPWFNLLVATESRLTALRDPRIAQVSSMTAQLQGDALSVEFNAITSDEEQFPSTRITVPIRKVA